ncbi:PAS domain S-box protein [Halorussus marinus]|uniref:PAS domain S-box protein n=1 Tax=Halorussus marinus TaxID=2505976 RepID=UPI00106EC7C9|nr:PAS domain S-box protein [Halorussus marinus]
MSAPGPSEGIYAETLAVFGESIHAPEPLSTTEVADALDVPRRTAYKRLDTLAERGDVATKKVGASARVWWRPDASRPTAPSETTAPRVESMIDVLDGAGVGVFVLDADFEVARINDATERYFGLDREDVVGRDKRGLVEDSIADRVDDATAFADTVLATYDDNTDTECFECRVTPGADREPRWLEHWSKPIDAGRYAGGRIELYYDITDQKHSEQALAQERSLTDRLLETAPIRLAIFRPDGSVERMNSRVRRELGREDADLSAFEFGDFDVYDPDGDPLPVERHPVSRVLETGEPVRGEVIQHETPDGDRRWVSLNAAPLFDPDGDLERVVVTGKDITALKRTERALARQRDQLQLELDDVFTRITDGMLAVDLDWTVTYVNDHAKHLLGRPDADLRGKNLWEAFPEQVGSDAWERYHEAIETQRPITFETRSAEVGGWVQARAYPSETGLSIYFRDITERKEREARLEEARNRYQTLVEHFPNGAVALVDADEDGRLRYVTVGGTAIESAGVDLEDLEGQPLRERLPPEIVDEIAPHYEAALDGEQRVFQSAFGDRVHQFRMVPVHTDDGEVFAALGMSQDITELKARERELERYETIVETVDDGIYALDDDLELTMVNSALAELIGDDREDLLGTSARTITDDVWDGVAQLEAEMRTGDRSSASVECTLEAADGDRIPVEATWVLRSTDDADERVGTVRDVSDRKARERELQNRVQQQRALAEFSQHALEDRSLDELFDEAVERVADVLDHDYCKVLELLPEADELRLRNGVGWRKGIVGEATVADDRSSQAGYTLIAEEPVVVEDLASEDRFSGPALLTDHDVQGGISTVVGSYDEPWGILGTHDTDRQSYADHDVQFVQSMANILTSAIRRYEREQQLERYETIIETADDGVFALDADERFVLVNEAFCELTGYDRQELLGRHASVVHSERVSREAAELSEQVADGLGRVTMEVEFPTRDGGTIPVESRFGPYRYDTDTDARAGIVRDISERKEREQRLRAQNERLESFASMLAHELRNPVTIGQIYTQQLSTDPDPTAVEYVTEAFDRIEDMIDVMLVLTRGRDAVSGDATIHLEAVAREAWAEAQTRDATVDVALEKTIEADETYISHLFRNLFENAVEHGGADVTVTVGDLPDGFYVADDGEGIPAGERETVFEVGYTTASDTGGTGLGLAFVAELADVYEWTVTVTESPTGGARFEFRDDS